MDTLTLCGWSAYQWHRIPPLVRMLHLSGLEDDAPVADLLDPDVGPLFGGIDYPLHVLAADADSRHRGRNLVPHTRCGIVLRSHLLHIRNGLFVTDPALTLLTLADTLSAERLALAVSEFICPFTVYQPTPETQLVIDQLTRGDYSGFGDLSEDLRDEVKFGWKQSRDQKGNPTSLWKRRPLCTKAQLEDFASSHSGVQGRKKLLKALEMSVENAASPFEVATAILLGQPRRRGGENLGTPLCNREIRLSPNAQRIAARSTCYGDVCFQGRGNRVVDIECHSKIWHTGEERGLSDACRATAITCMNVEVMHITMDHLRSVAATEEIVGKARRTLGLRKSAPTARLLEKRAHLRSEILVDWETFGVG